MIVFIEPVKGVREIADRIEIKVINYQLNNPEQSLYFCLKSQFNPQIEEGNLIIPAPVVAEWGIDDSVIIDWALDVLGLTEREVVIEEEEPISINIEPTPEGIDNREVEIVEEEIEITEAEIVSEEVKEIPSTESPK